MDVYTSNEELMEATTKNLEKSSTATKNKSTATIESLLAHSSKSSELTGFTDGREDTSDTFSNDSEASEERRNLPTEDIREVELVDEAGLLNRDSLLSENEKEGFKAQALAFKMKGNAQFRNREYYESVISYSEALQICPLVYTNDRSILFANRAASKLKLDRKESAIQDCSKAIELNSCYMKAYLRRATLYEETEKLDEALEDYKKILELDPRNEEAFSASKRLPQQIDERNEQMKEEMLDKLKDLGNMVLRPFGLSTNNFKMTKDPNSGGYSINFVQNQ